MDEFSIMVTDVEDEENRRKLLEAGEDEEVDKEDAHWLEGGGSYALVVPRFYSRASVLPCSRAPVPPVLPRVTLQPPQTSDFVDVDFEDHSNGTYTVKYLLPKAGKYRVEIDFLGSFRGQPGPIRGSPFFVDSSEGMQTDEPELRRPRPPCRPQLPSLLVSLHCTALYYSPSLTTARTRPLTPSPLLPPRYQPRSGEPRLRRSSR